MIFAALDVPFDVTVQSGFAAEALPALGATEERFLKSNKSMIVLKFHKTSSLTLL